MIRISIPCLQWVCLMVYLMSISLTGCKSENVEEKYYGESAVARAFYQEKVAPLMEKKCFSCHSYHTTSGTRYDSYSKAASMAPEITRRIHATGPEAMPPLSVEPLSAEEIKIFDDFLTLVQGNTKDTRYQVRIYWTAYKFADSLKRAPVNGTFTDVFINYANPNAATIYEHLQNAEAIVNTSSVNVSNDTLKNHNLRSYFFSVFSPVIYCKVKTIDPTTNSAVLSVSMNGISNDVSFTIVEAGEDLIFTSIIPDIRTFNSQNALDSLQKVCGVYHENKVWPDIVLKAEVKNYKNFNKK